MNYYLPTNFFKLIHSEYLTRSCIHIMNRNPPAEKIPVLSTYIVAPLTSSDVRAYLNFHVSPVLHINLCILGLLRKLKYALTPKVRRYIVMGGGDEKIQRSTTISQEYLTLIVERRKIRKFFHSNATQSLKYLV